MDSIINSINTLFDLYKDNPYMLQRLQNHLSNLPLMLEQENKRYQDRVNKFNELLLEQDNFYKIFLSKYQYFYMPFNNIYYEYDGKTYKIIKDDDIHHHLLSTITEEGKLIQWKHKTKQSLIKKIKERTLFKSVPETYTIQNILGFLQTFFQTKTEAKYFLTVIGDCILKKNTENLMFFVSSYTRKIIQLIDSITYITTGNSIMNNFISKYHDSHNLQLYRLIKTNDTSNTISFDIIKNVLNKMGIDFLCVATHYSDRYVNSDNYLKLKTEDDYLKNVLYFENNTIDKIIDDFLKQCIQSVSTESTITWKNMHYIWKLYLNNQNIPNMIYTNNLQQILSQKLTNTIDNNNIIFTNITSKYLPNVSSFLNFWEKHITIINNSDNTNTYNNSEYFDEDFEIDELVSLYKQTNNTISDEEMIKMIYHYFGAQVEIIENKYVTNISCKLWSKKDDILDFLNYYKVNSLNMNEQTDEKIISLDDLYQFYKTYMISKNVIEKNNLHIVSKQFFEKFVSYNLSNFIKFEKFVSLEWMLDTL